MAAITVNLNSNRQTMLGVGGDAVFNAATDAIRSYWFANVAVTRYRNVLPMRISWCEASAGVNYMWSPTEGTYDKTSPCITREVAQLQNMKASGVPINCMIWNTPPWAVSGGNPNPAKFDALTTAWTEYLRWLRDEQGGILVDYIGINEPDQLTAGNIVPHYTPAQYTEMVQRAGPKFAALGLTTKWLVGEGAYVAANDPYVTAVMGDSVASPYVGGISFHAYDTSSAYGSEGTAAGGWEGVFTNYGQYGLPVLMTEGCAIFNNATFNNQSSWYETARTQALNYWHILYLGHCSTYGFYEFSTFHGGTNLATAPFFYVVKDICENMKSGGVMVTTTTSGPVKAMAYKHVGNNQFYLFGINDNASASESITFSGLPNNPLTLRRSQSNGSTVENMTTIGTFTPSSGTLTLTLPAWALFSLSGSLGTIPGPTLTSLVLNPPIVTGGNSLQGELTLSGPAPAGGASVDLASSNTAVASIPGAQFTVISAGLSTWTFTINTSTVTVSSTVTITATYQSVSRQATLTVNPLPSGAQIASLTVPASITGGATAQGTVTIDIAAPTGGTAVSLLSNYDRVNFVGGTSGAVGTGTELGTAVIPQGSTSTTFTLSAELLAIDTTVTITGTVGSSTAQDTITADAPELPAIITPVDGIAIPGIAQWRSDAVVYGERQFHYLREPGWETGNGQYDYDPGVTFFKLADYSGNSVWNEAAILGVAIYYNYISQTSPPFNPNDFSVFTHGLTEDWLRNGNTTSRNAVLTMAAGAGAPTGVAGFTADEANGGHSEGSMTSLTGAATYVRPVAYGIKCLTDNYRCGGPDRTLRLNQLRNAAFSYIDFSFTGSKPLVTAPLPDSYFGPGVGLLSFWMGLLLSSLIELYEITGDTNIPPKVKTAIDGLWNEWWIPTGATNEFDPTPPACFCYGSPPSTIPGTIGYPGLDLLIAPAFAWYYFYSGNPTYQQRFDAIFETANPGIARVGGLFRGKDYNQMYSYSFTAVNWRTNAVPGTGAPGIEPMHGGGCQ